ncbi:hypothetical protein QCN27_03015 [Cereibacter sp. SYSU M97828]|nr:hypothetical protein [Cereibacter flavus]
MDITDETLMAFADGELAEPEASELAQRIAADPDLAARVAMFRQTRDMFAKMPADPVPDALADRIRAMAEPPALSNVVPMRRRVPLWQLPAAAAVALAVGLGAGLSLVPSGGTDLAVLDSLPSGEARDGVTAVATFRIASGDLCREFEAGGMISVACRTDDGWQTRLAVATGGEGYAPVSGVEALDAWLAGVEAGDPLDPEAEASVLR